MTEGEHPMSSAPDAGTAGPRTAGWQPMETAPRDGTLVLLFDPEVVWIDWDAEDERGNVPKVPKPMYVGWWRGCWELAHYSAFSFRPTHWMPLPEAPRG